MGEACPSLLIVRQDQVETLEAVVNYGMMTFKVKAFG